MQRSVYSLRYSGTYCTANTSLPVTTKLLSTDLAQHKLNIRLCKPHMAGALLHVCLRLPESNEKTSSGEWRLFTKTVFNWSCMPH